MSARPQSLAAKWIDPRLEQAFDLIDAVLAETHPEHDAHGMLTRARDAVESADYEIERAGA